MDLNERLNELERYHDWQGLVAELERALEGAESAEVSAALHLRLGTVLGEKCLRSTDAIGHFREALRCDNRCVEALRGARAVYAELGNLEKVRRLLEAELRLVGGQPESGPMWLQLGDLVAAEGQLALAEKAYQRAIDVCVDTSDVARAGLQDLVVEDSGWRDYVEELRQQAAVEEGPEERARALIRAARVARRFEPGAVRSLLEQAYEADPLSHEAVAYFERQLVGSSEHDTVVELQRRLVAREQNRQRQAQLALRFGVRWGHCYEDQRRAAEFLEETLRCEPDNEPAFAMLSEVRGQQLGEWQAVVDFATELAGQLQGPAAAFYWAEAAVLAAAHLGDAGASQLYYQRLAEVAPQHPALARGSASLGQVPDQVPDNESGVSMTAQRPEVSEAEVEHDPSAENIASEERLPPQPISLDSEAPTDHVSAASEEPIPASGELIETVPPHDFAASVSVPPPLSSVPPEALSAPPTSPPPSAPPSSVPPPYSSAPPDSLSPDSVSPGSNEPGSMSPGPMSPGSMSSAPPGSMSSAPPGSSSLPPSAPPGEDAAEAEAAEEAAEDEALVTELREKLESQENQKRVHEVVKTLVALGDALRDRTERVSFYLRAAELYANRFMNQAEAVKTYEKILKADPEHEEARQYLLQMYEKRRDWEKLIRLRRAEAARVEDEYERAALLKEIAEVGSARIKKPSVCVKLWQEVLFSNPDDSDALAALAKLYERGRDFERLADVLERLAMDADGPERVQILTKLGQVVGDRLKDDERAITVYRDLVALEPANRRAQEQLKKRYVSLGRWDDLDEFYAASGRWDEFIRVLESNEARAETDEQKIRMLVKIADLWENKRERPERASRAYEKILALDPGNVEAATSLIPIYTSSGNARGLVNVLEVKLGHTADPVERLELLRQLGELYEARLRTPEDAYKHFRAAFELAPIDEQAQADAERLAEVVGEWQPLIDSYRAAVQRCEGDGDYESVAILRLRLGTLLAERVGNVADALIEFQAVCDAQPDNVDALRALEKLYLGSERYAELLEVYTHRAQLAEDPAESREVARQIAQLYETRLGDPQAAVESYQNVLLQEPMDAGALEALDRLYATLEDWERHAEVVERRLELEVSEAELVELKFRLAVDQQVHLGQPSAALDTYREVLALMPGHDGARQALEGMLEVEALQSGAAMVLEGIYEVLGDWENLIRVMEILAASSYDPAAQVELYGKVAEVAELRLEDIGRAFEAQARALLINPEQDTTAGELERLASMQENWSRLGELFHEVADQLGQTELAREYRLRAARNEERLGNVSAAARNYERLLEMDPSDGEALLAIDSLYRGAERWEELVGVFRRRIDLCSTEEESAALYAQLAQLQEQQLGRPEEAIASYREILVLDPTSEVALTNLDSLLTKTERWTELSENLEVRLKLADTEEKQRQLMLRLGHLCEERLGQVERAIETYREVLDRDPYDAEALASLERLADGDYELTVAEILEPLYQQLGEYEKLVRVYEVQARRAEDPSRRVELLHRIASLHEDVAGNLELAFSTYARALEADPYDEITVEGLDRLARARGSFEPLAEVYESLARSREGEELQAYLFSSAARVVEVDIQDVERSIELYLLVQQCAPEDLSALDALERLYKVSSQNAELSAILLRKGEVLEDTESRKMALFEAAELEQGVLGRIDHAISAYRRVLDLDPEDARALDALASLFLQSAQWEQLLEIQLRKVDQAFDPEEKKKIYYQMGAVYERELEDVPRAIDTYQRVLELDPDDLTALGRLDVLYQTSENWPELLTVLGHEAELTADPAEAVSFQFRIAELYEKRLQDVERAVELYRDVLNIQPEHDPTLRALEGIKAGESSFALQAASVLEPVYDAMAEWDRLVSVLSVQVKFAEDTFSRVDLLHRIALLHEERMNDLGGAFDWCARAVVEDSRNEESLGALERLAAATEQWPAVAQLYREELERLAEEPDRLVELGLRVAQVLEVQLDDLEGAVERYRGVLQSEPDNPVAIRSLGRLFERSERWSELADVLRREAAIAHTPDEILDCKYRLGEVYRLRLEDFAAAVAAYDEVLSSAPEHEASRIALEELFEADKNRVEVCRILEPLYEAGAEWERLVRVHEAQLASISEPSERLDMYTRICEDYEERLADPYRAFGVMARAMHEQPTSDRVHLEMERLAPAFDGGWEELANTYADVMSVEGVGVGVQALVGRYLARVFEEELADVDKAEEAYRYVLTVAPGEPIALENLDRIYLGLEQWAELAGVLEQRAAAEQETHEKVEFYSRLGRVYDEQLSQTDDALRVYRLIFDELAPSDPEATAALVRIYEARQQWERLEEVYRRQLDTALGDVEQADIRAKLARLASEYLGRDEEAIEGWKRVLDLRGEDTEALDSLASLYERRAQWAELGDILERLYDVALEDTDRVRALTRRARLFAEALGRHDEAVEAWQRVLDIDFSNLDALRAIAALRRNKQEFPELVDALHQFADRAGETTEKEELREVHRELAKLYTEKLEQPEDANDAWRRLLDVDAEDHEALDRLEAAYREAESWTEVVEIQLQRASALTEPGEKVAQLLEAASIWKDQVREYDRAVDVFDRILSIEPTHDFAFQEIEKLHTLAERWEPLIELYLARLENTEETETRCDLLRRIARVFEKHLDDADQSFDALVSAFAEDFGDDETVAYLERMAQVTERWGELINTANEWLREQTEDREKIRLCLRLGKWYGENLGRPEFAQPYYGQIHQLDPNNAQVLRQMAHIYRQSAQWKKMGDMLYKALEVATANDDRKTILVDLGELLDKHMERREEGVSYFRRALEVDPYHLPALEALERIFAEEEEHSELAEILERKVKGLSEPDQVATAREHLAQLYEQKLENWTKAGEVYRQVAEYNSANIVALHGLQRVYQKTQNWGELVKVLEQQLDVVDTERARLDALLMLAEIQEQQFLKADLAAERLEQALDIDPTELRAYEALERCYRRLKRWSDLITTCDRHIGEVGDVEKKSQLFEEIARVLADEMEEPDRAIDAYQNILDLNPNHLKALESLARLYEKQEDSVQSIEMMIRVADLATDGAQRVEMYYRIGKALDEKLLDRGQAKERFELALDLDPSHVPTLTALRAIAKDDGDWDSVATYLYQEQQHTEGGRAKARLLVELGEVRTERLGERELGIEAFAAAVQADPECEEAALPLVNEYVSNEAWDAAAPLAEMLVRRAKNKSREEQHEVQRLLGKIQQARGDLKDALEAYQAAHQLDLADLESVTGLAEVSFALEDWPSALTNYQKVLAALGEEEEERRAEVYHRLGHVKQAQGQAKQAINNYEKALVLQPDHRPTLEAMVELYTAESEWALVANFKRRILEQVLDDEERVALLSDIAQVWGEKQRDAAKAIEALEEAREIRPADHVILHKLLQHYQETGDWGMMIQTLSSISTIEEQDSRKARYSYTMAQLYRDKIHDHDRAVELFNEALDLDPTMLEAFERINKILTVEKNWKQLERQYRKMLHRVAGKGNSELEFTLWHQLGLVYRDRLSSIQPALEAFKMASSLKPDETQERVILSELYEVAGRHDDAIAEQRALLEKQPLSVSPYRALFRLYTAKGEFDPAWCTAAALAFMQQASPEEKTFFEKRRVVGMPQVRGRLTNDTWTQHIIHPEQNVYISKIFEMLASAALAAKVAMLHAKRQLRPLDKRLQQDPQNSTVTFAKTFFWAANVLSIHAPELYVSTESPGGVAAVPVSPPASLAGKAVLTGFTPQELTFICGRHLAAYRPDHYMRTLFATQGELTIMLFAGVQLAAPHTPVPPDMQQSVRATASELAKYMSPEHHEGLRTVVKKFIEKGARANIKKWNRAVELTSARAGLVLCGDLDICKKVLSADPTRPGEPTAAEKMKSLLAFSVSEDYMTIRKQLGVGVKE